jgi:anti-sigma factor RsiW
MISCKEVTELATTYIDGGLPFWRRLAFRMHVGMCKNCARFLDQVRKTIRLLGQLPPSPVATATRAELLKQFRQRNG